MNPSFERGLMNERIQILLPKLGESIVSATVIRWFKKVGDNVGLDEPLLEVSTDKVNSEIPAPCAGIVHEILAFPHQEVEVGEVLGILRTNSFPLIEPILTPAVLRLLEEKGIPLSEIHLIPHTGEEGRLTKRDIESYSTSPSSESSSSTRSRRELGEGSSQSIKMSPLRKIVADNVSRAFHEIPHATVIMECDITEVLLEIKEKKEIFNRDTGINLTITSFAAHALIHSISKFPLVNSSLEGDSILVKSSTNLGIAVSINQGAGQALDKGVIVPVIHACDNLSIAEIAKKIAELADRARGNTLNADAIKGGSITMTNFGMAGAILGIPIIRYPEAAIVGLGTITKQVRVMENDFFAIRKIMMVSLTFDHRIFDGIYACEFLKEFKTDLENKRLGIYTQSD